MKKFGAKINLSDLEADPVIMFQYRYYVPLMLTMTWILPTLIPWLYFGESFIASLFICFGRYVVTVNLTWLINSAAHMWGMRPFDGLVTSSLNMNLVDLLLS